MKKNNVQFQIQVKIYNYSIGYETLAYNISTNDISKFANFAEIINNNADKVRWNWFSEHLPVIWENNRSTLDTRRLAMDLKDNFDYEMTDVNLVKEFFLRFTPNGADRIENIKFYKIEEL